MVKLSEQTLVVIGHETEEAFERDAPYLRVEDVKEAIKNTLRDINFDHVNGPWHAQTIFNRINKSFEKNFGDALLGDKD